jgi:hypothetical protein
MAGATTNNLIRNGRPRRTHAASQSSAEADPSGVSSYLNGFMGLIGGSLATGDAAADNRLYREGRDAFASSATGACCFAYVREDQHMADKERRHEH